MSKIMPKLLFISNFLFTLSIILIEEKFKSLISSIKISVKISGVTGICLILVSAVFSSSFLYFKIASCQKDSHSSFPKILTDIFLSGSFQAYRIASTNKSTCPNQLKLILTLLFSWGAFEFSYPTFPCLLEYSRVLIYSFP